LYLGEDQFIKDCSSLFMLASLQHIALFAAQSFAVKVKSLITILTKMYLGAYKKKKTALLFVSNIEQGFLQESTSCNFILQS